MAFFQPLTKRTRNWHYGPKEISIIIVRRFGPIPTLYIILVMTIYKQYKPILHTLWVAIFPTIWKIAIEALGNVPYALPVLMALQPFS